MRQRKFNLKTCLFLPCLCLFPLCISSCGSDDEPDVPDVVENNGGNSETGTKYDPNSDHALSLALKEHDYGTIVNVDLEKAIIGRWLPVCYCANYRDLLDYPYDCDDYDGGYQFNDDGMCYYLDATGQIEGNAHSWSISDGMLRIYFRGSADDRQYPQMTTKGYLILRLHGYLCWKIYKKV